MKILSIDTASNICTVAILENTKCIKELIVNDTRNHSEKIMPAIEKILLDTNTSLDNIDLIVCDKGPGSFTGIRIGVGTVLAFKDCLNKECIGINSLEALSYNLYSNSIESKIICSIIDAKNDNVYFALYNLQNGIYTQLESPEFKNIMDVLKLLNSKFNKNITFIGDGAISYKSLIEKNITSPIFTDKNDLSSYSLGLAGLDHFNSGNFENIMPLYLRKSQAERALEEHKLDSNN